MALCINVFVCPCRHVIYMTFNKHITFSKLTNLFNQFNGKVMHNAYHIAPTVVALLFRTCILHPYSMYKIA